MNTPTELAREAWKRFETIHGPVYFVPEMPEAGKALGLKGYWMTYFAFRVAPLGAVGPAATTALFYNFHPRRVARALPDAWAIATPEQALEARLAAAAATLRRLTEGHVAASDVEHAADLLWDRSQTIDLPGRPLGAANQALPRPDDAYERLWLATSTLREHRGDGHNAALLAHDVGPAEAHILKARPARPTPRRSRSGGSGRTPSGRTPSAVSSTGTGSATAVSQTPDVSCTRPSSTPPTWLRQGRGRDTAPRRPSPRWSRSRRSSRRAASCPRRAPSASDGT